MMLDVDGGWGATVNGHGELPRKGRKSEDLRPEKSDESMFHLFLVVLVYILPLNEWS